MKESIQHALSSRRLPLGLGLMAILISLPALRAGWIMDDWFHRANLLAPGQVGLHGLGEALDGMFTMFSPGPRHQALQEQGVLPWWACDHLRLEIWRPLTALTHWLDYRLFPNSAVWMHVHSLLWFGLAVTTVAVLYRRIAGPVWVAGLAGLMYALDEAHYFPALWIANRNELLAVTLGALTLICHHSWSTTGSRRHRIGAMLALLGSLTATEAGIATLAYLVAYTLTLDRRPWPSRWKAVIPYGLILIGWRLIYNLLGHGTGGNGFMIDPMCEPWAYVRALVLRSPILVAGQLGLVQPEVFDALSPGLRDVVILGTYGAGLAVFWALIPVLRVSPQARFWWIGMVLSILPISASIPLSRNFMFVAIGAFGGIAQSAAVLGSSSTGLTQRLPRWTRLVCVCLLIIHLPLTAVGRILSPRVTSFGIDLLDARLQAVQPDLKGRNLMVINAHNPFGLMYLPLMAAEEREGSFSRLRVLSPGWRAIQVERLDDKTLVIRAENDHLFEPDPSSPINMVHLFRDFATLVRSPDQPFEPNQTCVLSDMQVQVTALDERQMPKEILFRFRSPLDDPNFCWIAYDWNTYQYYHFQIPVMGQIHRIPGPKPDPVPVALRYVWDHTFQDHGPHTIRP